jgi:hypothetical protein
LTDYYSADPIPSSSDAAAWMYRIHNRVNGKLREQKLLDTPDPSWSEVKDQYTKWIAAPCSTRRMVGWDFFFSVAYTTPSHRHPSAPMPGAPPRETIRTNALLNRWNMLPKSQRIPYIKTWWASISTILPFPEWREAWNAAIHRHGLAPVEKGRNAVAAWLFRMEKDVCSHLKEAAPHDTFEGLCSELSTFSSGCGSSKRSKTCRATKKSARLMLKTRRQTKFRLTGGFL